MARRSNFSYNKRQRELKKKQKTEQKLEKRRLRRAARTIHVIAAPGHPSAPSQEAPALEVTDAAAAELADILRQARPEGSPDLVMRIEQEPDGQLAVVPGPLRGGDARFEHDGVPVLAVDHKLAGTLDGRTLDVIDEERHAQLVLR